MKRLLSAIGVVGGAVAVSLTAIISGATEAGASPTCSSTLVSEVHGQHVVGDYVVGNGTAWPPAGNVGQAVGGSGAAVPGGPGPGFHFPNGFAPGASFCLEQSKSPGFHPGHG